MNDGINAVKEFETVGGTPSGILIVQPLFFRKRYNLATINATKNDVNSPLAPSQSEGKETIEADLSVLNGVTIRKLTNAIIPASIPYFLFSCPLNSQNLFATKKTAYKLRTLIVMLAGILSIDLRFSETNNF